MAGAIRGITVEIGGDTTKLGKALAKVNTSAKGLQAELKGVNTLLKMDPTNVTLLKQKQDLLTNSIANTKAKLDTLKEAQAQVQKQFEKGEVTEEQYRDFQREIVATEQKLKSLEDELRNFGSVGAQQIAAVGKEMVDLGGKITNVGEKLAPISGAFAAAGTASVMSANDLTSAVNNYLMATGTATEGTETLADGTVVVTDNMEEFKSVIEEIYSGGYGEGFDDIAAAMTRVTTNMGDFDDAELRQITESALVLRDVFEFDVNESTRTAKMLMDQFGISSDDAFNLMAQGAQNGLDKNGDLLDTINEYSVHFEQLGFGAEEMFNILANGADSGTFSVDKLGDAFKEFGIRVKDGSKSSAEAFEYLGYDADKLFQVFNEGGEEAAAMTQILIDELASMPDSVEKTTAGVALFGTMWEDLGDEGIKALSEINGEISVTNDALNQIKEQKFDNLTSQIQQVGREFITNVAIPIGEMIMPIIAKIVDKVGEWVEKFGKLSPTAQKIIVIIGAIVAAAAPVLIIVGKIITAVGMVMTYLPMIQGALAALSAPVVLVVAGIAALVAAFIYFWNTSEAFRDFWIGLWEDTKATLAPVIEQIQAGFVAAWEFIKSAWAAAQPYFAAIWEGIKTTFSLVGQTLGMFFRIALDVVVAIWNTAVSFFQMVWEGIKNVFALVVVFFKGAFESAWMAIKLVWSVVGGFFLAVWNTIKGIFAVVKAVLSGNFSEAWAAIQGIVSAWSGYFSGVWEAIKGVFSAVSSWFSETFQGAYSAITNIWDAISGYFSDLYNDIIGVFSSIGDEFSSIGSSIIDGIWSGISSGWSWLSGKVSELASSLYESAKNALDINSPSRVFRYQIGKFIPEGIALGINDEEKTSVSAIENVVNRTVAAARSALNKVNTNFGAPSVFNVPGTSGGTTSKVTNVNNHVEIHTNSVDTQNVGQICDEINRRLGLAY